MNNKIIVTVYVPLLDESYDIFIPINKKIGTIKRIILSSIRELSNVLLDDNMKLYNKNDSFLLEENIYVSNSEIRNGSKLLLI